MFYIRSSSHKLLKDYVPEAYVIAVIFTGTTVEGKLIVLPVPSVASK